MSYTKAAILEIFERHLLEELNVMKKSKYFLLES